VASLDGIYLHYYFDNYEFDILKCGREFVENFVAGLATDKQ
jgi:hypothetical protein